MSFSAFLNSQVCISGKLSVMVNYSLHILLQTVFYEVLHFIRTMYIQLVTVVAVYLHT